MLLSFRLGIHPRDRVPPSSSRFSHPSNPSLHSTVSLIIYPEPSSPTVIRPPDMRPSPLRHRALRAVRGLSSTGLPPVLYTRIQIFLDHGIRPSRPLLLTIRPDNEPNTNASQTLSGTPSLQKRSTKVSGKSGNSFGMDGLHGTEVFFSKISGSVDPSFVPKIGVFLLDQEVECD